MSQIAQSSDQALPKYTTYGFFDISATSEKNFRPNAEANSFSCAAVLSFQLMATLASSGQITHMGDAFLPAL
jgi:hypothetical protein